MLNIKLLYVNMSVQFTLPDNARQQSDVFSGIQVLQSDQHRKYFRQQYNFGNIENNTEVQSCNSRKAP